MLALLHYYLAIAHFLPHTAVASIIRNSLSDEVLLIRSTNTTEPIPSPIVVPPSQQWDGDDGQWSSFALRAGIPAQDIRVLISTNSPETVLVLPNGCLNQATNPVPNDCTNSRGGVFEANSSVMWEYQGSYDINTANLGNAQANYGLDTIGLGSVAGAGNGPTLGGQNVAGVTSVSPFYMGTFGLGTQPTNYSIASNYSVPSYLTSLQSQALIPSLSWSYTAGAKYRSKDGQYGQLILGGYDKSRFAPNAATFSLASDSRRDIVVEVQTINFNGSTQKSLLTTPIQAFIESTDANIWLPEAACQAFENAFGLSKDAATDLYLINSTHYASLQAENPQVTFTLVSIQSGETVDIVIPFSAFALSASYPFTPNSTYYFPLKVAANETQYTLGRTFLQEAYLTVDHERGNFSVSQCLWNEGAATDIKAIVSSVYDPNSSTSRGGKASKISVGAIIGIVVGLLVAIVIAFIVTSCVRRRRRVLPVVSISDISIVPLEHVIVDEEKMTIQTSRFQSPEIRFPPPEYRKKYPHLADGESGTRRRIEGRRKTPATFDFKNDTSEEIFEVMGDLPPGAEKDDLWSKKVLPPSPLRIPARKDSRPTSARTEKWRVKGPVSDTLT